MEVLIPLVLADLIDDGITAGNMDIIIKLGLVLLLFAIMSLVFGVFAGKYAASASAGFAKNLRHDLFYAVQNFPFATFTRTSPQGSSTRLKPMAPTAKMPNR